MIADTMTTSASSSQLEGCVVSEHTTATDIGISMFEQGGNAIDAVVATILAVGTLCPYHSDIGGSGFALVRTPDGEHHALSFRGCAPDAATSKFYQNGASTQAGGSAVAVPGEIKGLKALHDRYGSLPWKVVVEPSIALARDGFELHRDMYEYTDKCTKPAGCGKIEGSFYENDPMYAGLFEEDGRLKAVGSHWSRPEYAEALQILADEGDEPFYSGRIAQDIVKVVQERGGLLNMKDMETYEIMWLDAIEADYKGGKVFSVPAPASGAMFISALGLLSTFEHEGEGSAIDLHRTTEAMKLAFGLRTELGDPEFVPQLKEKQKAWTSAEGIKERAKMITDDKTHEPDYYKSDDATFANADHGTSNITATDSSGLMCSVTTTVGLPWGSGIMVPKWGLVLNDSMDDFSIEGRPNGFGYEPSPTNLVKGRKRPLSSSCPYIVEKDGRPILIGGAAGGSAIITSNIQVARNVLEYGMTAQEAVSANRIHDQIQPRKTCLERAREGATTGHTEEQAKALEAKGHTIEWLPQATSTVCVVKISYDDDGKVKWEAAGEPRKHMAGGKTYSPSTRTTS